MNGTPGTVTIPVARDRWLSSARSGLLFGIGAYTIWGFIPLYFHALAEVPSGIVLCHRIVWSAIFMSLVISIRGEWKPVWLLVQSRRNAALLSAGAVLIALNWLIFIYAVATRQLLQASLGYFINPLLSIVLGVVFLRERLRKFQWLAVGLAFTAVLNLAARSSGVPWIAVSLACTFGFYGLVRKRLDVNSLHGLFIECGVLVPIALLLLVILPGSPTSPRTLGVLSLSGIITAVPLIFFGAAVRRLRLSTMGFLQYVGPTLQFLVAICLFREKLDPAKFVSFGLSWMAIGVYVMDSLLSRRTPSILEEPE